MRHLYGYRSAGESAGALGIHDSLCDVFVKIGGSILNSDTLTAELVPHIAALSRQYRIVLLPGGGQAVKRIKTNQKRHGIDFYRCWVPAVLCLDVNAGILSSYSPALTVVTSAEEIFNCCHAGDVAVLAAAGTVFNNLHLTPDFRATTDSMGLYFAKILGASRYVIVSDVHGIYRDLPREDGSDAAIPRLTIEELEQLPSSKLDPSFPEYFRRYATRTIVVNGKYGSRVSAAISGDSTIGTEIEVPVAR